MNISISLKVRYGKKIVDCYRSPNLQKHLNIICELRLFTAIQVRFGLWHTKKFNLISFSLHIPFDIHPLTFLAYLSPSSISWYSFIFTSDTLRRFLGFSFIACRHAKPKTLAKFKYIS